MKTLTNESKARFFAHNIGQLFNLKSANTGELLPLTISRIKQLEEFNHWKDYSLIKTPLQNISDEHADYLIQLEMSNWSIYLYEKLIIDGNFIYFTPIFAPHSNKQEMINLNRLRFDQHKYLQSRGYAIPFYCPIENRIIPVQEQIDNGWITLKEE